MEPDKDTPHPAAVPEALTLRDLIAMSALTGLLSSDRSYRFASYDHNAGEAQSSHQQMDLERSREQSRRYAREAYALADAMLAARAA